MAFMGYSDFRITIQYFIRAAQLKVGQVIVFSLDKIILFWEYRARKNYPKNV